MSQNSIILHKIKRLDVSSFKVRPSLISLPGLEVCTQCILEALTGAGKLRASPVSIDTDE